MSEDNGSNRGNRESYDNTQKADTSPSRRRFLKTAGSTVAVGGLMSGCSGLGGGGSNIDELTLLMEDVDDTQILDEISTQYEDETGVEITFETFPYGGLRETAVTQLRSPETEYDLMQIDTAWFGEFVEGDLLQPIDDRIDNSEAISRDVYTDPVWNAVGEYNGTAYALPFYNYAYGLLYRDDLINDEELQSQYESEYGESLTVPESVEEYVDTAIFMTRDTDDDGEINIWGTAMQGAAGISILDEWLAYFYALGGNYVQDGDVVFGDHIDTAVEAIELYQRQMENAAPEAAKGWGFNQASELMSNGEAFTLMTYNWLYQRLQDSDIGSQLGISNVPGGKPILGAWGLGIPENIQSEARADAVWDFLTWAESSDIRKERASRGGAPTCVDTLTDEELLDQFPNHYPALRGMLENGVPLPNIPSAGQVNDIIGTALNEIITGDADARETLTSAAEEMSSAVEE